MFELPSSAAVDGHGATALDAGALRVLRELDPTGQAGLVVRILSTYLGSLDRLEAQYRNAMTTSDWPVIEHVAHTLKSSSASVGALDFSRQCADLEQEIRQGRTAGLAPRLQAFEVAMARARAAVQQHQEPLR